MNAAYINRENVAERAVVPPQGQPGGACYFTLWVL
jgi:hypothetical protein